MKKIIAAFDGLKYSESTRDYAIYLAKQTNTHLVGVFMDDPTYTSYKIYELIEKEGVSEDKLKNLRQKIKLPVMPPQKILRRLVNNQDWNIPYTTTAKLPYRS